MNAAACLTLAAMNLLIWQAQRESWERFLFSLAAVATAAMAFSELSMLRAETPGQYATALRWFHVAVWWIIVTLVCFVRLRLQAGRPWLAWTVCALRTFSLLLNFLVGQNITYRETTHLRHLALLGESFAAPSGVPNSWMLVAQLSNLIFVVFVAEATLTIWRRGDRRETLVQAGSILFFGVFGTIHATLVGWQLVDWPVMTSFFFMAIVAAMSYEMSRDVLRAAQLSVDLRESEERMALAAEAAGFGFWMWSIGRDQVWGSEKWLQLFGFVAGADISYEGLIQRIHPDDREMVAREMRRAVEDQRGYAGQYRVIAADGTERWIGTRGRMYPEMNGKPARMLGVAVDITERKEVELELARQRDQLTNLSRVSMLGELSGALAHELNQPLTAILSNAQAAWRFLTHNQPDLDEVRDIIADIVAEDKRAGEIIHRLRLLFKTGAVQRQPLNLNEVIEEVLKLVRSDLVNQGVNAQTELALNLPILHGDRGGLEQVLFNLVMNACDAMAGAAQDNRQLTICTDLAGPDCVRISVSDCGAGIAPEKLEQVFDPFYTSKPDGLGLGLAVCRTIITAHGGKVWATKNPEGGATFHFTLPAEKEVRDKREERSGTMSQRSLEELGLTQRGGR
jgi:two-component system sensor kinase FixL